MLLVELMQSTALVACPMLAASLGFSTTSWQGMIPRSVGKSTSTLQAHPGLQNGLQDKRADVLLRVLKTIKTIQPLTFALENVKPLARHKKFKLLFDFILAFLRSIEDANGKKVYQVECKVPVHCKLFG